MILPLRKTILVVEDTALVLHAVRKILEHADFTVLAAAGADEAMQLARTDKTIDLLLSDAMMPGICPGRILPLKLKQSRPEMRGDLDVWLCQWRIARSELWMAFHRKAIRRHPVS